MCDIKSEPETSLCRGCLSSDRKLSPLTNYDLYWSFLRDDQKLQALNMYIQLCWECSAMLRRTQAFQAQVQRAHGILQHFEQPPAAYALSPLTVKLKQEYDAVFKEYSLRKETEGIINHMNVTINIKEEKDVVRSRVHNNLGINQENINDRDDLSNNLENDEFIDITNSDHGNKEAYDIVLISTEKTARRSSRQAARKCSQIIQTQKQEHIISRKTRANPEAELVRVPIGPVANKITLRKKIAGIVTKMKQKNVKARKKVELKSEPVDLPVKLSTNKITKPYKNQEINRTISEDIHVIDEIKSSNNDEVSDIFKIKSTNEISNIDSKDLSNEMEFTKVEVLEIKFNDNAELKDGNENDCRNEVTDGEVHDLQSNSEDNDSDHTGHESKQKKNKENPDSNPNFIEEVSKKMKKTLDGNHRKKTCEYGKYIKHDYKKEKMQYTNVAEVMQYYTLTEMSEEQLQSTLEKENAFINERNRRKCTECGQSFTFKKHRIAHTRLAHDDNNLQDPEVPGLPKKPCLWRCIDCSRPLRTEHLIAHRIECHRYKFRCNSEGCEWTPKVFWNTQDVIQHWKVLHRKCICDVCGHRSPKNKMMLHIQEKHMRLRSVQCPHCPRSYMSRSGLFAHVKSAHAPPGPPETRYCVECDVTYRNTVAYKMHVSQKHRGVKKFPCTICGRELSKKHYLQSHMSFHHKSGTTNYQCNVCGRYLCNASQLKSHLMRHNNTKKPPVKNKPCSVCGKMFSDNSILRFHMYTHTGERPHACGQCAAAFTQPHRLRLHRLRLHRARTHRLQAEASRSATVWDNN